MSRRLAQPQECEDEVPMPVLTVGGTASFGADLEGGIRPLGKNLRAVMIDAVASTLPKSSRTASFTNFSGSCVRMPELGLAISSRQATDVMLREGLLATRTVILVVSGESQHEPNQAHDFRIRAWSLKAGHTFSMCKGLGIADLPGRLSAS